jgi:N-succinyldiaminopimelate aminotransferase
VTSGATEAIFDAIQGICNAGDEVILFEPFYDSYKASVAMAGAVPRYVTLHAPNWKFDVRELESAFTPKTRAIVLNSPHNPTGKVYSREELESIAALCVDRDVICITDEVYEQLVYEGSHIPMAAIAGMRDRDPFVVWKDVLADGLESAGPPRAGLSAAFTPPTSS